MNDTLSTTKEGQKRKKGGGGGEVVEEEERRKKAASIQLALKCNCVLGKGKRNEAFVGQVHVIALRP